MGYPDEADAAVLAGDDAVLDELRAAAPGPSGVERTLQALAEARGYAPLQGALATPTGVLSAADDRVAEIHARWATLQAREPAALPPVGGPVGWVNGDAAGGDPACPAPNLLWSVFMGENTGPTDIDDYVDAWARWWHPSPTVRALMTPAGALVQQIAWVEHPDELRHWQLYVCAPWQVALYAPELVVVDDDRQQVP